MICEVCGIDDRGKRCELVNGSWITLCAPCRRRHEAMISMVPVSGPADRRAEETRANCPGAAHTNANIDNCGLCAPGWGE